jgi:DnaJ-domain-containing protein 1
MDFAGVLTQAQGFLNFQTEDGEWSFIQVGSIKRITNLEKEDRDEEESWTAAEKARVERERQNAAKREAERRAAAEAEANKPKSTFRTAEEYDALEILGLKSKATRDEIAAAYRKLVKLYHPDRLRGLGVSQRKIDFAADRLTEINSAYRTLMAALKAA